MKNEKPGSISPFEKCDNKKAAAVTAAAPRRCLRRVKEKKKITRELTKTKNTVRFYLPGEKIAHRKALARCPFLRHFHETILPQLFFSLALPSSVDLRRYCTSRIKIFNILSAVCSTRVYTIRVGVYARPHIGYCTPPLVYCSSI